MHVECRAVGRRRPVEGELLPRSCLDALELDLVIRGDHERGAHDLQLVAASSRPREAPLERGQSVLEQGPPGGEGMCNEAVSDLRSHLRHARAEAPDEDARGAEGIRAGIEGGDHQRVAVDLPAKVELRLALPRLEDRPDRLDRLSLILAAGLDQGIPNRFST